MAASPVSFIDRLQRTLGGGVEFSQDPHVLQAYSQDLWPRKLLELREEGPPRVPTVDAVAWPESVEALAELVRACRNEAVALYPYGAGSGVLGGTIPSRDEKRFRLLVDVKKMKRVRSVDRTSMVVEAEAGIIGENFERHLNQEGLTLGHFPSSIYCSSLGGYLATRSAGQLSTKYGKIEDMVLSLEVVTADGEVLRTGRAPRSAMGPDLTQLLLGSEGTLCFFTAAELQVHPVPEVREMLSFGCDDVGKALEFSRQVMQAGLRPAVLRISDKTETSLTISGFEDAVAMVMIFEGTRALAEIEARETRRLAEGILGVRDRGTKLAEHWWEHRYDVSYKQQLILSHQRMILDTFEVAATWDRLPAIYETVRKVDVGWGVIMAHFSHFYHTGANIYFTLVSHSGIQASAVTQYDAIWERLLGAALESGATLSHHHGVGSLKHEWYRRERADWMKILERIKRGFDPENRFNPGKMGF